MADVQEKQEDSKRIEKEEEAKLKAKYPQVSRPGPQFLQKRLQKGQKYFDSGDYNMAKAKGLGGPPKLRLPSSLSTTTTATGPGGPGGEAGNTQGLGPEAAACFDSLEPMSPPTGDTIPTPEIITHRKASIHIPSKLVSSPH